MTTAPRKGPLARLRQWWRTRRDARRAITANALEPVEWESSALDSVEPVTQESFAELAPGKQPLLLVARGDVFEFQVLPHFRWQSHEMSVERLREKAGALAAEARDELLKRAWPLARTCDAVDAERAEKLINSELATGWCYEDQDGVVKCRPTVRLRVDAALRDRMRPVRLDEQAMKEHLRLGLLKADHARQLTEAWLTVIADLEQSGVLTPVQRQFLVPFAATLADGDLAAATEALRESRRTGALALANVLNQATRNHEQIGLFEFAKAYDKASSSFSQQMGLTPFSWILDRRHTEEGVE
ncbi:hypothetical protein RM863_34260 [Streptomyces sp. DSM 41014]|uniref:Uncharacterized protein n=1 Tax=Streptomyces hintoniae TaxID=3075521 RepID=A0ABU2UV72_9ACTN|nr:MULTISPECIES: hypothetical protein [unclassified Streptomyces]MDH6700923.1 hypothetical protein [Streptomyces sp. MAA16]MDT0477197.1 hypothetical protein [Streptomyces sp. DSM 41014]